MTELRFLFAGLIIMKKNAYENHIKELLKNKNVQEEYKKLLPEYELAKSIIEQLQRNDSVIGQREENVKKR